MIAPDPEETGEEAEAELAEKLEEEEAGAGPEEALTEASPDAAEGSAT